MLRCLVYGNISEGGRIIGCFIAKDIILPPTRRIPELLKKDRSEAILLLMGNDWSSSQKQSSWMVWIIKWVEVYISLEEVPLRIFLFNVIRRWNAKYTLLNAFLSRENMIWYLCHNVSYVLQNFPVVVQKTWHLSAIDHMVHSTNQEHSTRCSYFGF